MNPGPRSIVPLAFATRFLQWGALGFLIPIGNLLRLSKGLSLPELGFSSAILSATVIVLELPTGILADRIGRKRTYLAALAFAMASCAALFFARGFVPVTLAFCLYGVSRALASGSLDALLIDRYIAQRGESSLHRLLAVAGAAEPAGLALGSLAGGLLPPLWERVAPWSGRYDGNIAAMAACVAVLLILVLVAAPDDEARGARRERLGEFVRGTVASARRDPVLLLLLASMAAWGLSFSAVETYWQPRVAGLLGSDREGWVFGLLSAGYFGVGLLGSLAAPLAIDRLRARPWRLLAATRVATAVFMALLAAAAAPAWFSFVYLVMFFWNGVANPPEATILNRRIPSERRASILSAASLAVQLGGLVGGAAFGLAVGALSIPSAWLIAAAVLGASAALYLPASRRARD